MKVLQQLSQGLAIGVLRASISTLDHHLTVFPPHMHSLAIEAAFPSLSSQRALNLDCDTL